MRTYAKPILALASGVILLSGLLCQTAHAQNVLIESSGALPSILAPTPAPPGGYALNPQEYVTVAWQVWENLSDSAYTYYYTVYNPPGDVLYSGGALGTTPEDVADYSVDFNTAGAYVPGTVNGGFGFQVTANTIEWLLNIPAGANSGFLQFTSFLPPTMGNAISSDSSAPAPWTSVNPDGQQVPVPNVVPEPATTTLFGLAALLLAR